MPISTLSGKYLFYNLHNILLFRNPRDSTFSQMWMSTIKEILVYHQELNTTVTKPALTKVPEIVGAPGLVDYEAFLHRDNVDDAAQVTLLIIITIIIIIIR